MENKIQELAEKLLNEGVEKGKIEAEKIINSANEKSATIISEAKSEAENIIATAQKTVLKMEENTKSELKMYTEQALNALKSEIANVVSDKIIFDAVNEFTTDKNFMREFVLKLAEKWGENEDLVILTEDAKALKSLFASKAKSLLDKGLKIEEVNNNKTLFTIQPSDGSYKIDFGKEEFENYFKSFLRPQLIDMLF
jgi:V/A-type H+-transporting ATPase subunit E